MSLYVPPRIVSEKAVLGPGAASMMTLRPLASALQQSPQALMKQAQAVYHSDPWIRKAEQVISFKFGTVDWHLEDENDERVDETATGPALDALNLLERPQANLDVGSPMTRSKLWTITSRHMGLCGNAFWYADQRESLAGTPKNMLYINPARMWPAEDDAGNLTGWVLDYKELQGTGIPIKLEEVYHFVLDPPDKGHFGIGLVESAMRKVLLTQLGDSHAADVLSSGGRLSGIVSAKAGGTIPDGTFQQLVRDMRAVTDASDAAKRMTIVQGPIDFTRTVASPVELALVDLLKMSKEDTLALWGVPLSQIGGTSAVGLNSGDVRKYDEAALWQNAIHPRLATFWEVVQYELLDRFAKLGAVVELEIEEPEFDDDSPRYDLLQKSINIAMTNAERRALIGKDPTGDPTIDNAIFLPATLVEITTLGGSLEPQTASPTEQALGRAEPDQAEAPQDEAAAAAGEQSAGNAVGKAKLAHLGLPKLRANIAARMTPRLKSSVAGVLAEMRKEVAARIRKADDAKRLPRDPARWWDTRKWDARLTEALRPHLAGVAETVSAHVAEVLPKPAGKAGPPGAVERVLVRGAARVTGINETTRQAIADFLTTGIDEGMGPAELADAIEAGVPAGGPAIFDEYRAELIARTELMDAYNGAALGSYSEAGIEMVEALDGDDDAECAARNGQTFTVDEADAIEDHPNGTLDWVPVIKARLDPMSELAMSVAALATRENPAPVINVTTSEARGMEEWVGQMTTALTEAKAQPIVVDTTSFTEAILDLKAVLTAPRPNQKRRVVRDEQGRIVGLEESD